MQEYPEISIIIPVLDRNKDKYLGKCLASIANSEYPIHKITVIIKEGFGYNEGKSLGLKEAKGEFICFLDSDNVVLPNYFKDAIGTIWGNVYIFNWSR